MGRFVAPASRAWHGLGLALAVWLAPACRFDGAGVAQDGGAGGEDAPAGNTRPDADPACPAVHVRLDPVVPTVQLLLDQSGSMSEPFGATSRWDAMTHMLVDPVAGIVPQLAGRIVFGATLYTSHDGGPTCPVLTSVYPVLDNAAAIELLLSRHAPEDDTPTGPAIAGTASLLAGLATSPTAPSPKIIVLATDGEPDTCAVPDPQTEDAQAEAVAAAQAAQAQGIRVFVVSLGGGVSLAHQQALANAGAGLAPDGSGGNAPLYRSDDAAELRAAFDAIVLGVRSCSFPLGSSTSDALAEHGTVVLNGTTLVEGDPDGWRLADPMTLELLGEACRTFLMDPSVSLSAELPCGSVVE